jgi:hypothetical protein
MSPPRSGVVRLAEQSPATDSVRVLQTLARYVRVADSLLSDSDDDAARREVEHILSTVEDQLGRLAGEEHVDGVMAHRLFTIRDELSAQLLAAAALEEVEVPRDAVVGVLRRAADSTKASLDRFSADSPVLPLRC